MHALLYFVPIFLAIIGSAIYRRNFSASVWLTVFAMSWGLALLVLRVDVGFDYRNYVDLFEAGEGPREPLSASYFQLSKIHENSNLYIAGFAVLSWSFLMLAFCRRSGRRFAALLFLALPMFYIAHFSIMRQSVAVSICMLAYTFRTDRPRVCLFLTCSAILFHASAMAFMLWIGIRWIAGSSIAKAMGLAIIASGLAYLVSDRILGFVDESVFFQRSFGVLSFYSGSNQFGLKIGVMSLLLLIASRLLSRVDEREFFSSLTLVVICLFLTLIDGVFSRLFAYAVIPILFVEWKVYWGNRDISVPVVAIASIGVFYVVLSMKVDQEVGPFLPYNSFVW